MATVSNVTAGKPKVAGAIYTAPSGTTLPTDASTALASAYVSLGFVSEDGVVNNNTPESDTIKAWGGQTVLTVQSEKADEFTFTLLEALNADVLAAVYGSDNVTEDTSGGTISVVANSDVVPEAVFVIDLIFTGGALKRIVIPNGSITEVGEITYKDDEAVGYELTISALPDDDGNNHYEYIKLAS